MRHPVNAFTENLRACRRANKLSQLDLAMAADVSQRHLSWLETGRSQPSRAMILRLSETMNITLRQRNQLLQSAGFAPLYSERGLDEPAMAMVRDVLVTMLTKQEPYPTLVLDGQWNIRMQNRAADGLFAIFGDPETFWSRLDSAGERNLALATVHPQGFRQFICNWDDICGQWLSRLRREASESGDPGVQQRYARILEFVTDEVDIDTGVDGLIPMLPIEIEVGETRLSMCSVISTFGTAQDITANELRIETFYPADQHTADILEMQQRQAEAMQRTNS